MSTFKIPLRFLLFKEEEMHAVNSGVAQGTQMPVQVLIQVVVTQGAWKEKQPDFLFFKFLEDIEKLLLF